MTMTHVKRLKDKYLPRFSGLLLVIFAISANGQTYNSSVCCTVSNKAFGAAQAVSTDGRSWFYDATNFVQRDYNGTTEVFSYLNLAKYRSGHFPIFVHTGGILQSTGVWVGGSTLVYWFKDSTGNANLVRWYTDSTGNVGGPFYAIANNLSEGNAGLIKGNLSLDNVNNTSDAQKNAAAVSLTNHTIDANNNTLLNIPNSALTNNSIGLTITANPAANISVTTTPAALGASIVANLPDAGTGSRGPLTAANWNYFNLKVDSIHISGDSVYDCTGGTCTFRGLVGGGTGVSSVTSDTTLGPAVKVAATVLNIDTMRWGKIYNVYDFGARGDAIDTIVTLIGGLNQVICPHALFTAADVGKSFTLDSAGTSGVVQQGIITGFVNSTRVTISTTPVITGAGHGFFYGTENTAGIQAAMDAARANYGGTVWLPIGQTGTYYLGGPIVDHTFISSQLYVRGTNSPYANLFTMKIMGESEYPAVNSFFGSPIAQPIRGVKIKSVVTAASGIQPSIIAFGSDTTGDLVNPLHLIYDHIYLQDLTFEAYTNNGHQAPVVNGVNAFYNSFFSQTNVNVGIDVPLLLSSDASNAHVAALIVGQANNGGINAIRGGYFGGYTFGIIASEHTRLDGPQVFACSYGLVIPVGGYTVNGMVGIVACSHNIYFPATQILNYPSAGVGHVDLQVECERDQSDDIGQVLWYNTIDMISDSANFGRGNLNILYNHGGGTGSVPIKQFGGGLLGVTPWDNPVSQTVLSGGADAFNLFQGVRFDPIATDFKYRADVPGGFAMEVFDGDVIFRYFPSGTANTEATIQETAFWKGSTGYLGFKTMSPTADIDLPASSSTEVPLRVRPGTQPTSGSEGMFYVNSTDHNTYEYNGSAWVALGGGVTTVNSFSGSSQTNGASISTNTITFGPADPTNPGMVSTGSQTLAGNKLLTGSTTVGSAASSAGERFTINGNTSDNTAVGVSLNVNRGATNTDATGGSTGAANTVFIGDNTFAAASAHTYLNAATLAINDAPTAGTNVTFTNKWALRVSGGNSNFNGDIICSSGTVVNSGHHISSSTVSFAAGAGAGSGPTITPSGADDGSITIVTGTIPSGSGATIVTATYSQAFPTNSYVVLTPANSVTSLLSGIASAYIGSSNSTGFTIVTNTTALTAATTYKWYYHIGGN